MTRPTPTISRNGRGLLVLAVLQLAPKVTDGFLRLHDLAFNQAHRVFGRQARLGLSQELAHKGIEQHCRMLWLDILLLLWLDILLLLWLDMLLLS